MSYRKITVDGKDYQYTVGRTHVKVHGFDAVSKESIGQIREYNTECSCGFSGCNYDTEIYTKLAVQPSDVESWIRSKKS